MSPVSQPTPVTTLLVANRGEIALRIIRSARARGIRTVAVYSDADRGAAHVQAADVAVHLGPTPAAESYLSVDRLLEAARVSGADAVHPGYGFLSERATFARAVTEAGLRWVGPSAAVIDQMGRKDVARDIAVAAGVPVVPRFDPDDPDNSAFPALVKAAAGGGGKGMRIVHAAAELKPAIAAAKREAASAFGDDTILLERYVERGRHVEVQVLADSQGNVVHLFERDCSAQRRHQKVLEEAPAPDLSPAAREVLLTSAVALARQVGYENAGTVEFLVDGEEVYFLEMNTRLQVEHPVTEAVVRVGGQPLDLVDLQLRVAAGEALPFTQDDVTCVGHAIEARVYAEDAFGGFLPQAGVATYVRWSPMARVDAALSSGTVVGTAYDPMLGKVIAYAGTREAARRSLVAALDDSAILGLTTNLGFVRALAASDAFAQNRIDTAWLDRHADEIRPPSSEVALVFAAWALARSGGQAGRVRGPFDVLDGWRSAGAPAPTRVELDDVVYAVGHDTVQGDGAAYRVAPVAGDPDDRDTWRLEIDGLVQEAAVEVTAHQVQVSHRGHTFAFQRPDAFGPGGTATMSDGSVVAPMPGTVLRVDVAHGDPVEEGQVLGVMEAMKMELTLKAPFAGQVEVEAQVGAQVPLGAELFRVDPT